ncbi:MAG: CotH kinase family protein, partial [Bacteroidota bacterium]
MFFYNKIIFLSLFLLVGSTYLTGQDLYDIYSIKDVKITFADEDWAFKLDSLKEAGNNERILANVSINGVDYAGVGVRYKGNSSFYNTRKTASTKLPFNIKANYTNKEQRFVGGYKTLKLSNVFRDPSYVREVLSYEIIGHYMSAPRANYVRLYVNDTYLGLYNSTESVDNKFLQQHFGDSTGVLIKCDPVWKAVQPTSCTQGDKASLEYLGQDTSCYQALYEMKTDSGWAELIALTQLLNEHPDSIAQLLDVDATLWMLAFNNVLVNLDSYTGRLCHNFYLYRQANGRFVPIPWDMNLSLGGFRFDGLSEMALTDEDLQTLSPFIHYKTKNLQRPLITHLLNQDLYRKIYIAHLKTIIDDFLTTGKYRERAQNLQHQIDFYVKNDDNKLYPYQTFRQNLTATTTAGASQIIGITELLDARTKYLTNHPLYKKDAPKISQVSHTTLADTTVQVSAVVSKAQQAYLCYRFSPTDAFEQI